MREVARPAMPAAGGKSVQARNRWGHGRHATSTAVIVAATAILAFSSPAPVTAQSGAGLSDLLTAPERTNHEQTTSYADVVAFMERVAAASPLVHLTTFGYSMEGRPLPLAIVARGLNDVSPESIRASGRTVVYLQGNIHAGEVEGKESLLMLLREMAQGRHADLLDSMVLLVAPIFNADGNERVRLTNRGPQHGPVGGMGTRANAQDMNINRDHTKLDTPEARAMALLMTHYDPHVSMDLHTTNGTRHAYYLTYSPPLHPNTPDVIIDLLRGDWLPQVTRTLKQKYGWDYYYYGNVQGQGDARGWYTFDHRPRFNNNYVGLRNRIAILSEAYSYATFRDRILATSRFVEEVLAYTHANGARIRAATAAADRVPVVGQRLATRARFQRSPEQVQILMGDVEEERNPYSGAVMLRRRDVSRPEVMWEYGTFEATETEVAPASYIVLEPTPQIISNLSGHGIGFDRVTQPRTVTAEAFRVDSVTLANNVSEGHRERTVFGAWQAAAPVQVPAGAIVVPVDQPLGRLAFTLLEPRSDDGLVAWNFFDRAIDAGRGVPVLRVR